MLTAGAAIEKIVEFVITKLAGRQIDLALDEKKRTAKDFLDLFESVVELERMIDKLLRHFQGQLDGKFKSLWMPPTFTRELADEIDRVSVRFLEAVSHLGYSVSLLDPALGVMLGRITNFKARVLEVLSIPLRRLTFAIAMEESDFKGFEYFIPSHRFDTGSLEDLYAEARQFVDADSSQQVEWPRGSGRSLLGETLQRIGGSTDEVRRLSELLSAQTTELEKARELLRQFICKNFKIEDLVFMSDRIRGK